MAQGLQAASEGRRAYVLTRKGVAHLEGSGQEGQHIVPSLFCEWGEESDVVSPCHAGRVTQSHPSCPRQRCRLLAEPHQSPIRIKAWERSPMRIHSGPWHLVPQTTVGTRPCPPHARTGCLASRERQPNHGSEHKRGGESLFERVCPCKTHSCDTVNSVHLLECCAISAHAMRCDSIQM